MSDKPILFFRLFKLLSKAAIPSEKLSSFIISTPKVHKKSK